MLDGRKSECSLIGSPDLKAPSSPISVYRDVFALGVRVGAPPDEFNRAGQDWGLPPFDPWRLRTARYEPFVATVRAGFCHAGGLRFDHVMGLFRLFWIPPEGGAADGTYVRYPHRELLDILSLESVRAGAYVVGEDLGVVPDYARPNLRSLGIAGFKIPQWEMHLGMIIPGQMYERLSAPTGRQ